MRPELVVMSHGFFAEQALRSAEMIAGDIENSHFVCMSAEDGLEGTRKKLKAIFDKFDAATPVLVVVDIVGGTPCNTAVEMAFERDNVRVLTGLNLNMIIEYALSSIENVDELAEFLRETGTQSVQILKINFNKGVIREEYEE